MPVIDKLRFAGKDLGLLAVLYPGVRVFRSEEYYPPFVCDAQVIVVSEEEPLRCFPEKQVIQVTSRAAGNAVDSRIGFLEILAKRGVKATNHQVRYLAEEAEDENFWFLAKSALILKRIPDASSEGPGPINSATVYRLFDKLLEDFDEAAKIYLQLQRNMTPREIISALLTMVVKSMNPRAYNVNGYYRSILEKNQKYLPVFRKAYWAYYLDDNSKGGFRDSDSEMVSVFAMIGACPAHTRPEDKGWFTEVMRAEFTLLDFEGKKRKRPPRGGSSSF